MNDKKAIIKFKINFLILFLSLIIAMPYIVHAEKKIIAEKIPFRIPYSQLIETINPNSLKSSSGQYLYQSLFRNLFWYKNKKLFPDLAENCINKNKITTCIIKRNAKWSHGEQITSDDFISSYQSILDPKNKTPRKDILFSIKNSECYSLGKCTWDQVGIKKISEKKLTFELTEQDSEFNYILSQTITAPIKNIKPLFDYKNINYSGPFIISAFDPNTHRITLTKNENYWKNSLDKKNNMEIHFVYLSDEAQQLVYYKKNELDLVKRLPTSMVADWKDKKDFRNIELLRFDYFGFNFKLITEEQRKILFSSFNFKELQEIFSSVGKPGCFQFSDHMIETAPICLKENLTPSPSEKKKISQIKGEFQLSAAGGDDHQRAAEWIQAQIKKQFNIDITVKIIENKNFLENLKKNTPLLFRKGYALEKPTCSSAISILSSESAENINQIDDPYLKENIKKQKITTDSNKKRKLCSEALNHILKKMYLIPTGRFDLFMLINPKFSNYDFNELNYLDLSEINFAK